MSAVRGAVLLSLLLLPAASEAQTRVRHAVARGPLAFEENRGQTDARVRFLAKMKGCTLFLTPDEAVFSLTDRDGAGAAVRMSLVGASASRRISGIGALPGKSHYFRGSDPRRWTNDVPTYAQVRYEGVYRGIDLVYYGNQQQLEYDFLVAPGASPATIRVRFAGVRDLRIAQNGDLLMRAGGRELRQPRPLVFQDLSGRRQAIAAEYLLSDSGTVGFRVGEYDPALTLIIDPVLVYSTYWGGDPLNNAIAVDPTGAAYVVGRTGSTGFPTSPGALQEHHNGARDAFVTKFDAAGAVVYSTYLGGKDDDLITSIAVDTSGAAYVAGTTSSVDFPTTPGAFDAECEPDCAAGFVTKLNPSGSGLMFSSYLGGTPGMGILEETGVLDIALDSSLNMVLVGVTGRSFPVTPGSFDTTPPRNGAQAGFIAKMHATGTALIYASFLDSAGFAVPRSVAADPQGNAYVTGVASSPEFPTTPGALQRTCPIVANIGGCHIAFVTKINGSGSLMVYSTFLGGEETIFSGLHGISSEADGVAVDRDGFAYVTGLSYTTDFPTTPGSLKETTTSVDGFVAKLNLDGSGLVYSTLLGGEVSDDRGASISVDGTGSAYVVGYTGSSDFPLVDPVQAMLGGGAADAFVAKLNPAGSGLTFSTYLGGAAADRGAGSAVDEAGNVYAVGTTESPDFPTVNAAQPMLNGTTAPFVAKIGELGEPACSTEVTGRVQVFQSAFVPFFWPFNLQLVFVWNSSPAPVSGPLAYVMDDLQNAVFVGSSSTRCFSPDGDPLRLVPIGSDGMLGPNEARLMGLWFYQTQLGPISYTPRLLSGPRNR